MAEPRHASEESALSRREFVRAAALTAAVPLIGGRSALAQSVGPIPAESAVARLYWSLSDEQRRTIVFPSDHPLRSRVQNNWKIVEPRIDDMTPEQQSLCREVFQDLCSEDGHDRFLRAMTEDYGGFGRYHVAIFGEPGTDGPFEWVLTGRHVTVRSDGRGAAFGGPIFYGHASQGLLDHARPTGNVWWHQGEQADRIFRTLDPGQRARALVIPKGDNSGASGLVVGGLDVERKAMVRDLLALMIRPFRAGDVEDVFSLREAGGLDALRLTYYKDGDIGDGVWDIWKLEGPAFSWYFHGSPHVHAWLDMARGAMTA